MKKTTLLWIVLIVIVIGGWYYVVNYTKLFSKTINYYGYYDDVRGLQESSPVYLHGVRVGKISEIDLNLKQKIRVVFTLKKDLRLPAGTKAIIGTGDVSGSKSVRLEPGTQSSFMGPESFFLTGFDSTMSENFQSKITPILNSGKILLYTSDSALYSFNQLIRQGWGEETKKSFASVNNKFRNAAKSSANGNQAVQRFQQTLNGIDSMMANPVKRNNNINTKLANAEKQTKSATKKSFSKDVNELGNSINKFSATIGKLRQNKMLSDPQAYQNATKSLDSLNRSTSEYMKDPPPLIKIGGGGKKTK